MPLPLPTLDRLRYEELVAEARSSLPALAPGWTDYNAHDPGITLVELLAWLAEGASYRLDQIPEASYRAFLRLAGVEQRPAQVSETMLALRSTAGGQLVPQGSRVQPQGGGVGFQTTGPVFVSDALLEAVVSGASVPFDDLTARNKPTAATFLPFGAAPVPGAALYLGFDRVLAPADTVVSLGVWTGREPEDQLTRSLLVAEQRAREFEARRLCPRGIPAKLEDWRHHYGVRTVWEYHAGAGQWLPLEAVVDDTRAMSLSGSVCFAAPRNHVPGGVAPPDYDHLYLIRCRLDRGAYDCPPRMAYIALNAVCTRHAADAPRQPFRSTGRAAQQFELAGKPAVPGSIELTVTLNGLSDGPWTVLPNWDGAGPHDRACTCDPQAGTLVFGDGRVGRVPPAGAEIAVGHQVGSGLAGNLPAKTLKEFSPDRPTLEVTQPFAASGGERAETLDDALARAVREHASPTRAATVEDCQTLALATPGAPLARAYAIPDYHPALSCIAVSGSITVVVLPPCPEHRPEPTAALCATVRRYLARRRVISGEIHVVPPKYTTVSIGVHLHAKPDADRRALAPRAREALERFFHPLHGGPDGRGWPPGRAVYRAELLALLDELEGVGHVDELTWRVDGREPSHCGNIILCRHGLVASGVHEITVKEGNGCHE